MMATPVQSSFSQLKSLQEHELSITRLGETLFAPEKNNPQQSVNRGSDASSDASQNPTLASLEADLAQYKDLFTKLRFSYVEQVTKEKFLRAVVGEPPLYVTQTENAALEAQLLETKASLKAQKAEMAIIVTELEKRGRELSKRSLAVQEQYEQIETLPIEIEEMKREITRMKDDQKLDSTDPIMALPLSGTLDVLKERDEELAALNEQLKQLEDTVERRDGELGRLENELQTLELQKTRAVAAAIEARRRKEAGMAGGDELEQRGRWLQGVEKSMKSLFEIEA